MHNSVCHQQTYLVCVLLDVSCRGCFQLLSFVSPIHTGGQLGISIKCFAMAILYGYFSLIWFLWKQFCFHEKTLSGIYKGFVEKTIHLILCTHINYCSKTYGCTKFAPIDTVFLTMTSWSFQSLSPYNIAC